MKNKLIISGFPGVGKSYFTEKAKTSVLKNCFEVYDSDSSKFPKENFPKNYVDYLENFYKTPDKEELIKIHFISTHKEVLDELEKRNIGYIIVYPDISLKEEYLNRYKTRGNNDSFIKLLSDNWEMWIKSLEERKADKHKLNSGEVMTNIFF